MKKWLVILLVMLFGASVHAAGWYEVTTTINTGEGTTIPTDSTPGVSIEENGTGTVGIISYGASATDTGDDCDVIYNCDFVVSAGQASGDASLQIDAEITHTWTWKTNDNTPAPTNFGDLCITWDDTAELDGGGSQDCKGNFLDCDNDVYLAVSQDITGDHNDLDGTALFYSYLDYDEGYTDEWQYATDSSTGSLFCDTDSHVEEPDPPMFMIHDAFVDADGAAGVLTKDVGGSSFSITCYITAHGAVNFDVNSGSSTASKCMVYADIVTGYFIYLDTD